MITGPLKSQVDKIWNTFWTGGISNPLTVIEQFTFLLFIRRLDEEHTAKEKQASFTKEPIQQPIFEEKFYPFRWSKFKNLEPESMFELFTKPSIDGMTVFDHMKTVGEEGGVFGEYMKGATFMIGSSRLLDQVVQLMDGIDMRDRDTKGDLYEYMLSKIASAGENGQFRTPRHIIKMMVEMMEPQQDDLICDPAAGTAGFLVAAGEYFHEHHPEWFHDKTFREHYHHHMFTGVEFDATMIRIGAMNLQLHGIRNPNLVLKDALSESNANMRKQFSLILANPPFTGSLDYDAVESSILKTVKTKKTELLFLGLMLRILKTGGRAAVIVPQGVQFGSSNAHKAIRQELVENQKLDAVISMPSGVFKPYAGVSTAILIFTKTESGGTDHVWFYDMHADGLSLDDKRQEVKENDLPDILTRWKNLKNEATRKRTEQSFMVPFDEIKANDWDLSVNRYKEVEYEEVEYEKPEKIIEEIKELDKARGKALRELESLLK
ncbi:MAG: SAM-dependent DNA methyltransferase [Cryomorphaceae bacterium]|nr:MAG: SAM-dependent DNA methyltransferase [Cryomorphaceae bacterium]